MRPLHKIPHRSGIVQGLVNVHGELLVVVSLSDLLGFVQSESELDGTAYVKYKRLVVLENTEGRLVFPVDEIVGTHLVCEDEVQEVPVTIAKSAKPYTSGVVSWNKNTIGCLDGELLFHTLNRSLA